MRQIDLNADLGEGSSEDAVMVELITSANIACGGHAGDEKTMRHTISLAVAAGVAVGAHPGYEDREHFGRRAMAFPLTQVTDLVARQVAKLSLLAAEAGAPLHHVKPHGALYNQADRDADFAAAVIAGITQVTKHAMLYALPGSRLADAGRAAGLPVCFEGFADRRYVASGSLMPRNEPGAFISNIEEAVAQGLEYARSGKVGTLCVHGEGPTAVKILRKLRAGLEHAGMMPGCVAFR